METELQSPKVVEQRFELMRIWPQSPALPRMLHGSGSFIGEVTVTFPDEHALTWEGPWGRAARFSKWKYRTLWTSDKLFLYKKSFVLRNLRYIFEFKGNGVACVLPCNPCMGASFTLSSSRFSRWAAVLVSRPHHSDVVPLNPLSSLCHTQPPPPVLSRLHH